MTNETKIADAPISSLAKNALKRAGIVTLADAQLCTDADLLNVPGFGRKSLAEVRAWIRKETGQPEPARKRRRGKRLFNVTIRRVRTEVHEADVAIEANTAREACMLALAGDPRELEWHEQDYRCALTAPSASPFPDEEV